MGELMTHESRTMRRASVKADENDMTISAYTRLEQMRSEIEAAHRIAAQSQVHAQAAIKHADHILEADDHISDESDDVIDRVNNLIEQAIPRPN
jgi:PDZ domain-containing secreted protein